MELSKLMAMVDKYYPDNCTENYHNKNGEFNDGIIDKAGDSLAQSVVSIITGEYDYEKTDIEQLQTAIENIDSMVRDLDKVALGLYREQRRRYKSV